MSNITGNYMQNRLVAVQHNSLTNDCSNKYSLNPNCQSTTFDVKNSPKTGNEIWGPLGWKFMHYMTFAYPDKPSRKERREAESFFMSLKSLLPCPNCKKDYECLVNKFKPQTQSKDSLSRWLVDIHNKVNIKLGKPTITYEHAKKLYCRPEMAMCTQ